MTGIAISHAESGPNARIFRRVARIMASTMAIAMGERLYATVPMREVEELGYDDDAQTLPVGAMLRHEYAPQRLPVEQ